MSCKKSKNRYHFTLDWIASRREINSYRVQRIDQVCQKYPQETDYETLAPKQYLFTETLQVLGCSINKAGSTSLRELFSKLRKKLDGQRGSGIMKPVKKIVKKKSKRDAYSRFLFIREPMERLASAYNDKVIVNPNPWLVGWRKDVKKSAIKIKGRKSSPGKTPSFDDFLVAMVIHANQTVDVFGRHWAPYYKICAPCSVKYNFIGLLDPEETKVKFMIIDHKNVEGVSL